MASILRFDNWENSDGTSIATTNASGDITFAGAAAKQSAIDKLAALGLSVDEIRAAFGLEGN